jgi:hypothetical protein
LVLKKFKEMVKEPTLNLSFKQSILVLKKFKEMVKEPTLNLSFKQSILVLKKFKEIVKEPTLNLSFKQSILVFKIFKEMVKEPTLNLSFFGAFFEQTRQSFNFFLKLGTCTYFKSFNKNPEPGLFECENFQKLRLRCYNKIQEEPNIWFRQDVVFHCSTLKQSLRVVGWCHSARKVLSFQSLLRGPLLS